jgi:hypothetical protein
MERCDGNDGIDNVQNERNPNKDSDAFIDGRFVFGGWQQPNVSQAFMTVGIIWKVNEQNAGGRIERTTTVFRSAVQ